MNPSIQFVATFLDPARHVSANSRFTGRVPPILKPVGHIPFQLRLVPVRAPDNHYR
jgi:hypothetical protein